MAYLLRVDGTIIDLGAVLSLVELQVAVDGPIEYVPTADGGYMYCNAEGKRGRLQQNHPATELIDFEDIIFGDVVVVEESDEDTQIGCLDDALENFWSTYYSAIRQGHIDAGLSFSDPVHGRNKYTTSARHVKIIEEFCANKLAAELGVKREEVGPRRISLSDHRTKDFDICWPLKGEPKILISVKSMQNAYRNLTNRIEEAYGDLALLRMYNKSAVFGFYYVILDGPVARGDIGQEKVGKMGRMKPFTALVEEGGDYLEDIFQEGELTVYASKADTILKGINVLSDMIAEEAIQDPLNAQIRYDAIAFVPTIFQRSGEDVMTPEGWDPSISSVPDILWSATFFTRLVEIAKIRGFV